MPDQTNRNSLVKHISDRYSTQRAGGAFDVKKTLGQPNTDVKAGETIDAASANGASFQTLNGFETRVTQGDSQLKVVQSGGTSGISRYVKGIDTRKYSRFQ